MSNTVTLDDVWQAFRETDRLMRTMFADADRRMQETDRRMRETDRQMQETDLKIKEVSRQLGQLGGRLGEFVEEMIKPACIALFQARGIPVDEVYSRVKKTVGGKRMEIDLMLANTVAVVLIEVKSHLTVEDVRDHLERLAQFKPFFTKYAHCQVYGAVAGMVIAAEADRFAMNQGLFVIAQSGDSVQLANSPDFVPAHW
ncbi:MAG: DUF3782 domain-containing protein [Magnetococcales bacterium]|nr:DUF3782 domain-containing protein [Magnetococcales bacterium]